MAYQIINKLYVHFYKVQTSSVFQLFYLLCFQPKTWRHNNKNRAQHPFSYSLITFVTYAHYGNLKRTEKTTNTGRSPISYWYNLKQLPLLLTS
ncbi:hypothetical protein OIU77_029086 [Salix suchowensis]|uniref:Uncharacterized protein n=1 Tax=Salix suchowensis TaxID=1278906 RepID=A0ABQ9BMD7_9ROSI|nr:hypothetical protein OIU77_029086 [Salix suchowensis]